MSASRQSEGMTIGVLGGGLQGCCTALALADRGHDVVLFDQNESLLSRTATANEGKIHLGFMYVADPSMATARVMIAGALAFAPFIKRYVDASAHMVTTSTPANYVVHRDSQHDADEVSAYLADVHRLIGEAATGRSTAYFGIDLSAPPRRWAADETEHVFNRETVLAVFETPEVAIDPDVLAAQIRARIADNPRIRMRLGHRVVNAEAVRGGVQVNSDHAHGREVDRFDHVVNALWDGRLTLDAAMGHQPSHRWLHRLKYGITLTLPEGQERPPSMTVVSGPFGEVVSHRDGRVYLTWYPVCLKGLSTELTPPDWPRHPHEPQRSQLVRGTVTALSEILPDLNRLVGTRLQDALVKGGIILAWGQSDIYDPTSQLHQRYEIGVKSFGRYHSIDPGKLTLAPYFAELCADRIGASF
jgi:glycine/D-amino acid oxidase-like deaminating enzyme